MNQMMVPIYTTADPEKVLGRLNDMYNPNAAAGIAISQTAQENIERHKDKEDMQYILTKLLKFLMWKIHHMLV